MDGGGIFPPREGASRAVYGKGESLAPRKMKFQVLPSLLLLSSLSLSLLFSIANRFGELFMPMKLARASGK